MLETDASGNNPTEYVFFNGRRVARRSPSGAVNYYFADHLGTSRVVANATGTILDDSDFYPFGGERVVTSSSGNAYKFTGHERDTETGLDYMRARYYFSSYGRFLSPDEYSGGPVDALTGKGFEPGPLPYSNIKNPQSLNKYNYVLNNPLRLIDPDGHAAQDPCNGQANCTWSRHGQLTMHSPKQAWILKQTIIVKVTNDDGSITITSTTTTVAFSTAEGQEGSFVNATQTVTTRTGQDGDPGSFVTTSRTTDTISYGDAAKVFGGKTLNWLADATARPDPVAQFAREVGKDIRDRPLRFAGRVIGVGALVLFPPTTVGGAAAAVGAAGADLTDTLLNPDPPKQEKKPQ